VRPTARAAAASDLPALLDLYAELETEMVGLKPIWAWTDGLARPIRESLQSAIDREDSGVVVGELDGVPFGFLVWVHRSLLPQAGDTRLAAIDLIFTHPEARRVGVGEAMIGEFLAGADAAGITLFDAVAPPGHRDAKNFFESNGFKARRIVMHRSDGSEPGAGS